MNNQQLAQEGLTLVSQITANQRVMTSDTAVAQLLHSTPELNAYFIAARQPSQDRKHNNLAKLYPKISQHFNKSELIDLAHQLGVEHENLVGETRQDKARELVTYMERRGYLPQLIEQIMALRPNVKWQDEPQRVDGADIISRPDIAIVVDVSRPALADVGRYLDERKLAVNFVLLKPQTSSGMLSPGDGSWNNVVRAFAQAINAAKSSVASASLHFFLSAPGALIFGMGCIWGTVDEAIVYHYEKNSYYPVINVSRGLRA